MSGLHNVLAMVVVTAVVIYPSRKYQCCRRNKWRSMGDSLYVDMRLVEAQRGNILAADGSAGHFFPKGVMWI
ncbi:MAG: hypothetical protein R2784_05230 [Saprospiraceae bacterium]